MVTLVTGGTGMLGAHVMLLLTRQGRRVRATYRNELKKAHTRQIFGYYEKNPEPLLALIDWVKADMNDYAEVRAAMQDVQEVYHAAAMVSFSARDARQMIANNRTATANVVNAALDCGGVRLCHVSSVAALGETEGTVDETTERVKGRHYSAYSESKFESEMEVWRGIAEGLQATIVNPSIVIGAGDWTSSSTVLFAQTDKGMPFFTRGTAAYVSATDVATAMLLLMEKGAWGERFVLNSENLTFTEIFGLLSEKLGRKAPTFEIKKWQLWAVWALASLFLPLVGKQSPITRDLIHSAFTHSYFSSRKIQEKYGFRFTPIAQAVDEVAKIYRSAHP